MILFRVEIMLVDVTALMGVEKVQSGIIGAHPDVSLTVGLYGCNALCAQRVLTAPVVAIECGETVAVVAAQTVPGGYPYQAVTVLTDGGDGIGGQTVVHGEMAHADRCLGQQAGTCQQV